MEFIEWEPDSIMETHLTTRFRCVEDALSLREGILFKENDFRAVRRFESGGRGYFIKQFFRVPRRKQAAYWLGLVASESSREWRAIHWVRRLGIPTVQAVMRGESSRYGMERGGFCVTRELPARHRLEDFMVQEAVRGGWFVLSRQMAGNLARMVSALHRENLFHKDLYLGHVLVGQTEGALPELFLIDLQRLDRHRLRARRFQIKDLAALHFSVPPGTVSKATQMYFFKRYLDHPRLTLEDKRLIRRVLAKSKRIARHTERLLRRKHGHP